MKSRLIALVCLLTTTTWAQNLAPVSVKQITAPASDIINGRLLLPDPALIGVSSHAALIPVELEQVNGVWSWVLPIDVSSSGARVVFMPSQDQGWSTKVISPSGHVNTEQLGVNDQSRDLDHKAVLVQYEKLAWTSDNREFACFTTPQSQAGSWTLRIEANPELEGPINGFVIVDTGFDTELYTHVTSLSTVVDQPIVLKSSFSDGIRINTLSAELQTPSGIKSTIQAPRGADEISFRPSEPGQYIFRVQAKGIGPDGKSRLLTTQHVVHAETFAPKLGQIQVFQEQASPNVADRIQFVFEPDASNRRTIIAAQVWGLQDQQMVPVCWISQICDSTRQLSLDPLWITYAKVDPNTLELREVRVHDIDSMVPIEIIDSISLQPINIRSSKTQTEITTEMLKGPMNKLVHSPTNTQMNRVALPGHRLLLSHGYCSDANPFPTSHFAGDIAIFEDFGQSKTHDAFALEMLSQTSPMKSFGVAGHSQAGMAALHLSTFYWSGLDWSQGDRLIQSVGAPYQGTALAGNAAVLGDLFGFGCGVNDNMTYTGSANWLSLIPTWARAEVWYWTTSFEDRVFIFDFCNIITDLLLSDPDDGVIERSAGQLSGANNMGHLEGWCHTTGMRDPAQCTDQSRNTQIDMRARR
ncbi:MAG: hypothetical protein P1U42_00870 [Phycisphaerales bacterium]|nr:hypothetical protein [Phycisphaerales bacterium]